MATRSSSLSAGMGVVTAGSASDEFSGMFGSAFGHVGSSGCPTEEGGCDGLPWVGLLGTMVESTITSGELDGDVLGTFSFLGGGF